MRDHTGDESGNARQGDCAKGCEHENRDDWACNCQGHAKQLRRGETWQDKHAWNHRNEHRDGERQQLEKNSLPSASRASLLHW